MPGRYVVVPRDGREEIVVPDNGGYLVSGRRYGSLSEVFDSMSPLVAVWSTLDGRWLDLWEIGYIMRSEAESAGCTVIDFEVEYEYSDLGLKPRSMHVEVECGGDSRVYSVEFVG